MASKSEMDGSRRAFCDHRSRISKKVDVLAVPSSGHPG